MSLSLHKALIPLVGLLLAAPANAAPQPEKKKPLPVRMKETHRYKSIDDPKTPLADVLEQLQKLHDITFEVNEKVFREAGIDNILRFEIAATQPMPELTIRIDAYLQKILSRVPVEGGATFTIRSDRVEITTVPAQRAEFWPDVPEGAGVFFPLVHADFDKKPLDAALKELAEQTELTIVLDARALDKEMPAVTARLANTPLDSAIIMLAEMTELRPVRMGKTIFVTSPKKAEALEKRLNPAPFGGIGMPPGLPMGPMGLGGPPRGGM